MKHLIIYSHLNQTSFTKAIVNEIQRKARNREDEVKVIDLYGEQFNPVLGIPDIEHQFMGQEIPEDVKRYQELISWADHLTVVYPMWWGQMPAILKGFIDRVFSYGFAFKVSKNGVEALLKGKTAQVYINTNTPTAVYEATQMNTAQKRIIDDGVFGFCGIKTKINFFGEVSSGSNELRKQYLSTIK